jgi:hypothetical protein
LYDNDPDLMGWPSYDERLEIGSIMLSDDPLFDDEDE